MSVTNASTVAENTPAYETEATATKDENTARFNEIYSKADSSLEPFANEKDATRFANDYAKRLLNGTW